MAKTSIRVALRNRRKKRIRGKISGTAERPRLSVFRSSSHVYAQVIDDIAGKTLVFVSSFEKGQHRRANKEVCGRRCVRGNPSRRVTTRPGRRVIRLPSSAAGRGFEFLKHQLRI